MLRSLTSLYGYTVTATDGDIGAIHEFLFEDDSWAIKHMVVKTGTWLTGRKVLIPPAVLGHPEWASKNVSVNLTREQVQHSPDIDTDKPVPAMELDALHTYYEWPGFVSAGALTPVPMIPLPLSEEAQQEAATRKESGDPHLRGTRDLVGYHVYAIDGEIGHIDDFILDDIMWEIRYFSIGIKNWHSARKVLVSPHSIKNILWSERKARIDLTKESVERCPEYDPAIPVNHEYEVRLYDYYGRPLDVAWFQDP